MLVDEIRKLSENNSDYNRRFANLTNTITEQLRKTASEGYYEYVFTVKCESKIMDRVLNDLKKWISENGFDHEYNIISDRIKICLNWSK